MAPAAQSPATRNGARSPGAARRGVDAALSDLARGRPVVVLRRRGAGEGSGALVLAASMATPENVAFVVRHTTGFLCVAIDAAEAARLGLPPMAPENQREDGMCFTVTVDANEGITTGISATDRSRTIRLLADPATVAAQLSRPGHVVPVIPAADGVLGHQGFAEAGHDLVAFARPHPAALVADVVDEDGSLARPRDLLRFADEHGLACIELAEIVAWRAGLERSLERLSVRRLPAPHERVEVTEYREQAGSGPHLAFTCGALAGREGVPLYVHPACVDGDLFAAAGCDCRSRLNRALGEIEERGVGVLLYLPPGEGPAGAVRHARIDTARMTTVAGVLEDLGPRSFLLAPWQPEELLGLREHGVRLDRPHGARQEPLTPVPGAAA